MRLFGLLGGGWSINFSNRRYGGIRAFDRGSRRSAGFQLGRALTLGPGVSYEMRLITKPNTGVRRAPSGRPRLARRFSTRRVEFAQSMA